jgi:transcription termination factor NusB
MNCARSGAVDGTLDLDSKNGFYKGQSQRLSLVLKNALRVALYQILFLDKVPE